MISYISNSLIWSVLTNWMLVEADIIEPPTSEQRTTVPLKPTLVEVIDNVEIRGEASSAEVLVKVNVTEFNSLCDIWLASEAVTSTELVISTSVPCSLACRTFHLMNPTDAVHVIWSGSPTWHTGATIIGDNVNIPVKQQLLVIHTY